MEDTTAGRQVAEEKPAPAEGTAEKPSQPSQTPQPQPSPQQSAEPVTPAEGKGDKEAEELVDELMADEAEILELLKESEPKIYVVGVGGSGTNTLNRLFQMNVEGVKLIAANTDARHLLQIKANRKILLGKKLTKGRGCGSYPECGEKAAKEAIEQIKEALKDANLVFITYGLGGGTGTGAGPEIAKVVKNDIGALTVAVVTLPFSAEGRVRMENALKGLEKLKRYVDTLIVIKNDKLLSIAPDMPLDTAFKVSDEVLASAVKGIVELVTKAGMVNVDFADLTTILKDAGYAVIGLGEATIDAKREERAKIAIETALNSPLLDVDLSTAKRALINVVGGEDLTLKEAELIVSETAKRISPDAHIIWGARIEPDLKKTAIKVLVVLAGVNPLDEAGRETFDFGEVELDVIA